MTTTRHVLMVVFLVAATACETAAPYDVVLLGGRVMDPESSLDAVRNVGVRDGRVAEITEGTVVGRDTVVAAGLVVAPGFIDLHAHGQDSVGSRLQALDGVTMALELEIGVYPVAAWYRSKEGRAVIHYGATVSHLGARVALMHGRDVGHWPTNPEAAPRLGPNPRGLYGKATPPEVDGLAELIARGLGEGALGVGFGINYTPGAAPDEIERLFQVAQERGRPVFVHTRTFGLDAIREAIAAAEKTGAALHIVHIGSSANRSVPAALELIRAARARGVDVTTEVYPYTAASTRIESAIFDAGWRQTLNIDYGHLEWPATGERLTATSFARHRRDGGWVIIHMMAPEMVALAVAAPDVLISSDGVPFVNGTGHPRGAGTFARVLGRYVREQGALSLMEALRKITLLPALRLEAAVPAMRNKGRLRVDADADITLFDPQRVIDRATFRAPTQPSAGIAHVLVGGVFVVRDSALVDGVTPGRGVRAGVGGAP